MSRLIRVALGDLYCMQASVGAKELSGRPSIFHQATPEEILSMTRRHPLDVCVADLARGRCYFLTNGTHRAYVARYLSAEPSPRIEVYCKQWPAPCSYDVLERLVRENRTVCSLGYRP